MKKLTGKIFKCKNCGKKIYRRPSLIKRSDFFACSRSCRSTYVATGQIPWNKGKKGSQVAWNKGIENPAICLEKHPSWKGGRIKGTNGYILIRTKQKKYRTEHRIIMEKILGRKLLKNEVVHHKDHNRANNNPNNLMLFPNQSTHIKYHHA